MVSLFSTLVSLILSMGLWRPARSGVLARQSHYRLGLDDMTLRHDISQFYALKTAIQQLLGNRAWLDLKECTSVPTWRSYVLKLLEAVRISTDQSIEIRDESWVAEVHENLQRGTIAAKSAKEIDELVVPAKFKCSARNLHGGERDRAGVVFAASLTVYATGPVVQRHWRRAQKGL